MKYTLKALVLGLAVSATAFAGNPPPTIKADAPNRYVVKKGDTLWDISGKYLDKPTRWREIWATNRHIKNPNLIYPNDILILCVIKGQTLVGVDTGEGCAGVERQMTATPERVALPATDASIPAIPLASIRSWLNQAIIVDPKHFNEAPYVIASKNGNLITSTGDTIYAKIYTKDASLIVGEHYGIYRKGEPYIDQSNNQLIGLEAHQVASAFVKDISATGVATLQIRKIYNSEVQEGDRVFVEVDAPTPNVFYPAPAEVSRGGMIIRTMSAMNYAAKHSVVAINLGTAQGVKPGHVLDVYKKGALISDYFDNNTPVRLPSELAGQIMVFKAFNNISYAYVLSSEVPLKSGDTLLPPEL